jgi:hypothetical protein
MPSRFELWWQRPVRTRDRVSAAFVGLFAGFWIGFLGKALLVDGTTPISVLFYWGIAIALVCAIVGALFPRHATIVFYPFAFFGISGN